MLRPTRKGKDRLFKKPEDSIELSKKSARRYSKDRIKNKIDSVDVSKASSVSVSSDSGSVIKAVKPKEKNRRNSIASITRVGKDPLIKDKQQLFGKMST